MKLYVLEKEYKVSNQYGYCKFSFEKDEDGEFCHIYNLYVHRKFRRQGHARELLTMAILQISELGHSGDILIVCNPTDTSVIKSELSEFYESMGLKVYECYSGCDY